MAPTLKEDDLLSTSVASNIPFREVNKIESNFDKIIENSSKKCEEKSFVKEFEGRFQKNIREINQESLKLTEEFNENLKLFRKNEHVQKLKESEFNEINKNLTDEISKFFWDFPFICNNNNLVQVKENKYGYQVRIK